MLEHTKALAQEIGFNPYRVPFDRKQFLDLASNNYLGLAQHPCVQKSAIDAAQKYGVSLCGTPVASGYSDFSNQVSQRLAAFAGLRHALLFPSCYQANNGLFAALCKTDDSIIIDKYAHSSLIEGARAAGCKIRPFLHNNKDHLEKVLRRASGNGNCFVVTESVFSTEGSIAPLPDILALCRKYDAVPVIDDSHGIGVIGKSGRGILEHFGIADFDGIYTASLGKSLANMGGMVAGDEKTMEYLSYLCPHLVYSTALTPPVLGGVMGALDVIGQEFAVLSARMWRYKQIIAEAIGESFGDAPINTIFCGSAAKAIETSKRLYEKGILSTPFIEPSVPQNACIVRLIAGAGLSEENVLWAAKQICVILSS